VRVSASDVRSDPRVVVLSIEGCSFAGGVVSTLGTVLGVVGDMLGVEGVMGL